MPDRNPPKVSVIIPAYNAERWLVQTIESVINQTFVDWELLIVDDGSNDGTAQIIQQFVTLDARISGFHQTNGGVAIARNHGFKKSRGAFLAFLDADDIWLSDNLELKLNKFTAGDFGLVHSDAGVISSLGQLSEQILTGREGMLLNDMLAWKETQVPGPSSILVKREVLESVGLFDEQLSTSADQDFFIRVAAKYTIGRVTKITWHYRIHENNMHKNIARMEHDVLIVFQKARQAGLFHSERFYRVCFSNMYLILAASWAGDGGNWFRAFRFVLKAVQVNPTIIFKLPGRIFKQ
jgi:glycosyltransferase involved in cell wall biosynthesis